MNDYYLHVIQTSYVIKIFIKKLVNFNQFAIIKFIVIGSLVYGLDHVKMKKL